MSTDVVDLVTPPSSPELREEDDGAGAVLPVKMEKRATAAP